MKDTGFRDKLNNVTVGPLPFRVREGVFQQAESEHLEAIEAENFDENYVTWIQQHRASILADATEKLISARMSQLTTPMVPLALVLETLQNQGVDCPQHVMQILCEKAARHYPALADFWATHALEYRLHFDIWVRVAYAPSPGAKRSHLAMLQAGDVLEAMRTYGYGMDAAVKRVLQQHADTIDVDYAPACFYHSPVRALDETLNAQVLKLFQTEVERAIPPATAP